MTYIVLEQTVFSKMSIRSKLIILFISLLALLLAFQGFLYLQYDDKVSERLGEAAFEVSKDTASVFIYNQDFLYETETFSVDENGEIIEQQLLIPENKNIQIRLADNIKDQAIRLISQDSEFQIPIPRTEVHDTIGELKKRNLWITFLLFAVAITLVSLITYSITKPLLALNRAAKKISQGELGTQVDLDEKKYGQDVSDTIKQFNAMSTKLVHYQQQQFNQQELEHFKELSSISRGLAHNLRNPLNILQLSLEQLQAKHQELSQDKLATVAVDQVQRIEDWLKSFTLLMEQGLKKETVSLKELFNSAAGHFDTASLEINCSEKLELLCVETEMAMILQILLQNAFESYEQTDSVNQTVVLNAELKGSQLLISVVDQGKGISDKVKGTLFKPYTTDKTYGSGMGLYIARRLIKHRYDGDLWLDANKPTGAIAYIKLPYQGQASE